MESFTGLFSDLSENLKANFVPIVVVLVLLLVVSGWLVYKSYTDSPKVTSEPEPESGPEPGPEQRQEVDESPDTEGFEQESEN